MRIIVILWLLSVFSIPFRVRVFEALVWTLLTTPVWGYLLNPLLGVSAPSYYVILLVNFLAWCAVNHGELDEPAYTKPREYGQLAAFLAFYIVCYSLILQWNEFTPIGERLRDYALLSSVMRSPIALKEPWLHGFGLNYYAYWYRFGHFIGTILNLPAAEIYNQLQALTYSLFLAAIFRLTTRFLSWSTFGALFASLVIGFGSNLQGVVSYLMRDDNWWGPSRVIAGAINEFPVWSFLLGDLHPHYLNLPMIPLLLLLFLHVTNSQRRIISLFELVLYFAEFLIVGALLIYNGNAWEVPIWGLTLGSLVVMRAAAQYRELLDSERSHEFISGMLKNSGFWIGLALTLLLSYSLYASSRNILPNPYPVSVVKGAVPRTHIIEFLAHWGIPSVALITAWLTLSFDLVTAAALAFAAITTIVAPEAYPFLWITAALIIYQTISELIATRDSLTAPRYTARALVVVAIILCLIPEYIFLDDPYGGENERMNTIFKIYSSNWFIFHLGALGLIREAVVRWNINQWAKYSAMTAVLIFCSAFFVHTISLRKTPERTATASLGSLADIADEFPGGAQAIQFLRNQPGTVVLEAQGNPYSWTSFVSTLSDKDAFLGWANHVELLNREYPEINRRKQITSEFYNNPSCERRLEIMRGEKIDYAVLGSLEKKQNSRADGLDFSCLKQLFSEQEYRIYGIPS